MGNRKKVIQPLSSNLNAPEPQMVPLIPQVAPEAIEVAEAHASFAQESHHDHNIEQEAPTLSTHDGLIGLTGSQYQPPKPTLPVGVYIVAAYNVAGLVAGFFDDSQANLLYTLTMLLNVLISIGLLMRLDIARKIMLWLTGITLAITVVSLVLLAGVQQRTNQQTANYETAVSKIDQTKATTAQKRQLAEMNALMDESAKKAGSAIYYTYLILGVTTAGSIAVIWYLTRPNVRRAFHSLEA